MSRLTEVAGRLRELSIFREPVGDKPKAPERLGQPSEVRPEGCLLWVAARRSADAGSVLSLAKELAFLREEPVHCLVTSETELPPVPSVAAAVAHQLLPVDTQGSVERFLDHWRPDVGLAIGTIDRPRLFRAAADRGLPLFYASSDRAARRRFPAHLSAFRACLASSAAEGQVLRDQLEGTNVKVEVSGPLSDTIHALPCNEAECDELAKLLGGRPVWLAAEAVPAEIELIETAHRRAFRAAHRLLLILVPQVLEDAADIKSKLEENGWHATLRSEGSEPDPECQIYIADTQEELGMWYRLAPISFVGGTLVAGGGTADPFDPAALGSAVLHGPYTGIAPSRFESLARFSGSFQVAGAEALGDAVQTLLAPDKAASLAQVGWAVTTESASVVERLAELMDLALDAETS